MKIISDIKKRLLQEENINIVFIGDSITSTEWVHPNWREIVEYVLKEELTKLIGADKWKIPSWGIRCFNCGFDGSTTKDILDMMDKRILNLNPTIAILLANVNDMHFNDKPQEYEEQTQKIINKLSTKCENIIVANSIPGNNKKYNDKYSKFSKALKSLKLNKKMLFIDLYKEYSKHNLDKFFTFVSTGNPVLEMKSGDLDFVHPNQLGNAYIAKIILENIGIKFNPEKFIKETKEGKMFPSY